MSDIIRYSKYCDLITGENNSGEQYYSCDQCYRFDICKKYFEGIGREESDENR